MAATPKVVDGLSEGVKRDNHPVWYPPQKVESLVPSLHVANSLTETLEPFVARNGRSLKWYTCGPTVYDHSHMGHARAYLTFDILRRIMEDYFGFTIEYQMNITDIDDKIIKRARINKLLSDFKAELDSNPNKKELLDKMVKEAVEAAKLSFEKKATDLATPLPANAPSRIVKEREEKVKELKLKQDQFDETCAMISAAKDVESLFAAAKGPLGDILDTSRGAEVIDQSIFEAHARTFEASFFEDMKRLGIREPDVVTRVTEYVPQVVAFIEKVIANGFAYVGESSVFFDTEAFTKAGHNYAKLKGGADKNTTEDEMAEGEGALSKVVAGEKKSPNDFALWKFSKPGEPRWPSPWGEGRPGWHIECSVMASDIFGANMDIHAGGYDLKFPHHDNECAQSEAYFCQHQWVNYFFHCGHLHIKGLKMSKSLKNFITIRQALDEVNPRIMRLLFLANAWDRNMNFGDDSLNEAKERDRVLRAFFGSVDIVLRNNYQAAAQGFTELDRSLNAKCVDTERLVHEALCRNFDTPAAINAILELVSQTNQYLLAEQRTSGTLVRKVARYVTKMLRVFGVVDGNDDIGFVGGSDVNNRLIPAVDALSRFRDEVRNKARETGQMAAFLPLCDQIRDEWLIPAGIRLEDKPGNAPTTWKLDEPAVLLREVNERKAAAASDRKKKLTNQLETKKKLVAKWEQYVAPPTAYFVAEKEKYSEFDATGLPTRDAAGEPIPEKTQKKLKKDLDKYASTYDEFVQKGGEAWLGEQRAEIAEMIKELSQ